MLYAEVSYFEGYHFQHIADWYEQKRLTMLRNKAVDRRYVRR